MNSKTCKDCSHFYGVAEDMNGEIGMCDLRLSEHPNYKVAGQAACEKLNMLTLFDKITVSPETLAEKLVYCLNSSLFRVIDSAGRLLAYENEVWASTILPGSFWTEYEEAFSATLAKLKEVTK